MNTLSDKDMLELKKLGKGIVLSLECDANNTGVPCRTDRFEAIKLMKRYLEIHDYKVDSK